MFLVVRIKGRKKEAKDGRKMRCMLHRRVGKSELCDVFLILRRAILPVPFGAKRICETAVSVPWKLGVPRHVSVYFSPRFSFHDAFFPILFYLSFLRQDSSYSRREEGSVLYFPYLMRFLFNALNNTRLLSHVSHQR